MKSETATGSHQKQGDLSNLSWFEEEWSFILFIFWRCAQYIVQLHDLKIDGRSGD
jgi:hypothetical protein